MPTIDFREKALYNVSPGHEVTGELKQFGESPAEGFTNYLDRREVARQHDNYLAWLAFLDTVRFDFPAKIDAEVYYDGYRTGSYINVRLWTHDRDGKEPPPTVVNVTRWLPEFELVSNPAEYLRGICLGLLVHEFDEMFYVGGVRVFDPHKDERVHVVAL